MTFGNARVNIERGRTSSFIGQLKNLNLEQIMKQRFSKEVLDLFESLAPEDDEVLNDLSDSPVDVGLKQIQPGFEHFVDPIPARWGNSARQTSADPGADRTGISGRENLLDYAHSVISKILYRMIDVPSPFDSAGAAAAHRTKSTKYRHYSETIGLRWQQGEETYELYYLEPDRNKAYVRCIQLPTAVMSKTKLLIADKSFVLNTEGNQVYTRWPLTALVGFCASLPDDASTLDSKKAPWIS